MPLPVVARMTFLAAVMAALLTVAGAARGQGEMVGPDYGVRDLSAAGAEAYEAFLAATGPKAFAVSAEGDWGWVAEAPSRAVAEDIAVERCGAASGARCRVIASMVAADLSPDALGAVGREAFEAFLRADGNKAFAIGPDAAWSWRASEDLPLDAVRLQALEDCTEQAAAPGCQIAAVGVRADDREPLH